MFESRITIVHVEPWKADGTAVSHSWRVLSLHIKAIYETFHIEQNQTAKPLELS